MDLVIPPGIRQIETEMVALRRQIHSRPELAFEEHETSNLVAQRLEANGYSVHRGLGGTGVVGTLKLGKSPKVIGLRADMDALPIQETTGLPYASTIAGKMHACGHDGHTAILLTAAHHLAKIQGFDGTLRVIFQPAEEGLGGGRKMVQDGLFRLFPCDAIFALHNMPGYPVGKFGFMSGSFLASSDSAFIKIKGRGGHGSTPHLSADPILASAHIILALQSIVSRNVDPRDTAVISVGAIHAGSAPNVIPDEVEIRLTIRAFTPEIRQFLRDRITEVVNAQAQTLGCSAVIDYHWRYPALINHAGPTEFARQVALDWVGEEGIIQDLRPFTGAEDFSFMLQEVPGSYFIVGNGLGDTHGSGGCSVHNPGYDFNDACLAPAASFWVRLVHAYLRAE
jgi:hippurate hydrolase